jgi:excisionase family DNA binding protein
VTSPEVTKLFDNSEKWPPILTVDQASALLGVPKSTLYEWHRFGRLNGCCRRRGNHLRFLRDRLIQAFFNGEDWK